MPAVKIEKFLGKAPKLSPELLPETVAQICSNAKLSSGDLVPYYLSSLVTALVKPGPILTVYPMDDGSGGFKWLHWSTDVDVARVPIVNNSTQRILYTGDGEPRVTNYSLATTGGSTAYPYAYYTLGLPVPLTAPTVSVNSFTPIATVSRARDSGNTATVIVASAHNLNTGAYVTMTGFTDATFNLSNVAITVVNSTTFTYYCYGAAVTTTADAAGSMNIAGLTQTRTYVYTWLTAWGEESVPSPISTTLYLKEGQTVAISALPSAWPGGYTGTYQTAGMTLNIYRTVPSSTGTYYYKAGNVALGTTTFTDNINVNTLTVRLASANYDQPPSNMVGIKAIHNNMLVGFYNNTICFSEPGQYHAWPAAYQINLDTTIVAIGTFSTALVIGTTKNPWFIQGSTPTSMAKLKMDYVLPCSSKRSMVNMGYGVSYATPSGLAVYSSSTGGTTLTKYVHDWDTWRTGVNFSALLGSYYNDKYFGTDGTSSFIFQKDDQVGGFLSDVSQTVTSLFYDSTYAVLYYVYNNSIYKWDDPTLAFGTVDWKSKVLITKDYQNFGAARVVADYSNTNSGLVAVNATITTNNNSVITNKVTGGAFGGATMGKVAVAGSFIKSLYSLTGSTVFTLYADKQQVFTTTLYDSKIFRLPTGYRTDTYEVRVTSSARVRAIHLGETPLGLKQI
jgi:hypothetical protein